LKGALIGRVVDDRLVDELGDIFGFTETLHDHGGKIRTLIGLDQDQLRPSDFAFDLLFLENYFLDRAFRARIGLPGFSVLFVSRQSDCDHGPDNQDGTRNEFRHVLHFLGVCFSVLMFVVTN
jgi:hypothetical protein